MINQFINYYVVHALLEKQKPPQSTAVTWTVLLISNYHLFSFCLLWYYFISWQNFDSGKCIQVLCTWSTRRLLFSHMLKGFLCLSTSAEPSEDGRPQKERSPPDPTSARTPPSTPIKIEEGMFCSCGGQGNPVTASLVTDACKYVI